MEIYQSCLAAFFTFASKSCGPSYAAYKSSSYIHFYRWLELWNLIHFLLVDMYYNAVMYFQSMSINFKTSKKNILPFSCRITCTIVLFYESCSIILGNGLMFIQMETGFNYLVIWILEGPVHCWWLNKGCVSFLCKVTATLLHCLVAHVPRDICWKVKILGAWIIIDLCLGPPLRTNKSIPLEMWQLLPIWHPCKCSDSWFAHWPSGLLPQLLHDSQLSNFPTRGPLVQCWSIDLIKHGPFTVAHFNQWQDWLRPQCWPFDSGHTKRVLMYWEKWGKLGKPC